MVKCYIYRFSKLAFYESGSCQKSIKLAAVLGVYDLYRERVKPHRKGLTFKASDFKRLKQTLHLSVKIILYEKTISCLIYHYRHRIV